MGAILARGQDFAAGFRRGLLLAIRLAVALACLLVLLGLGVLAYFLVSALAIAAVGLMAIVAAALIIAAAIKGSS